jgi:hypothetical protein
MAPIIVPKSQPSVTEVAPTRRPVLDFAGAMPTRDPMADAIQRGLSELSGVVSQIGERRTRREVESLLIDAETQMISAYSDEREKSAGHNADGFSDRIAETYKTIGMDVSGEADPLARKRFMDRWNASSVYYTKSAAQYQHQQMGIAEFQDLKARTETDIWKLSVVAPDMRLPTLHDVGGDMVRQAYTRASEDGLGPDPTRVAVAGAASAYTYAYLEVLGEESPGAALIQAKTFRDNLDDGPYESQSAALPPTNWAGKFPGSYPQPTGAGTTVHDSNVDLAVRKLENREEGTVRHYVLPTTITGRPRTDINPETSNPEYLDHAQEQGLEMYPWFATADEAQEWIDANDGNIDEDGSWGKFVAVLTPKQFESIEKSLAPRVKAETISGDVRALATQYPNSPEQAYRAARDTEYPAKVVARLKAEYKADENARKEQTEQHDAPIVANVRRETALSPRSSGAKTVMERANILVSNIEDPKVRKEQQKLVDDWSAGKLIRTDVHVLEDFNKRLEIAGRDPGDLRRAAMTVRSEMNSARLSNTDWAELGKRLEAIISPKREEFPYDGQNGYKKIVTRTSGELYGSSLSDKALAKDFESAAYHALLAEHMTGELTHARARDVVSQVANGFAGTETEWWFGLGDEVEIQTPYAAGLRGETSEEGEIPALVLSQLRTETGHSRPPSIGEISSHINAVWNRRIESGLEASQDIGFAPATFVDDYYESAERTDARLVPNKLNEAARVVIAQALGVPLGTLRRAHLQDYMSRVWEETKAAPVMSATAAADHNARWRGDPFFRRAVSVDWGDSELPPVDWMNEHLDAIERTAGTP